MVATLVNATFEKFMVSNILKINHKVIRNQSVVARERPSPKPIMHPHISDSSLFSEYFRVWEKFSNFFKKVFSST